MDSLRIACVFLPSCFLWVLFVIEFWMVWYSGGVFEGNEFTCANMDDDSEVNSSSLIKTGSNKGN